MHYQQKRKKRKSVEHAGILLNKIGMQLHIAKILGVEHSTITEDHSEQFKYKNETEKQTVHNSIL